MTLIYGDKVVLRRFEERMSEAEMTRLYEWSRDLELLRWSGGTATELTMSEFREHLRGERLYGPSNRRMFLVFTYDTRELIGRLGVFAIDWNLRQAELGVVIGEHSYWNRGYGRAAVRTLLRHLFASSSLNTIYLFTFAENVRAQRAFSSVGFRVTERARRFTPDVGEFDSVRMEITRREFLERDLSPVEAHR